MRSWLYQSRLPHHKFKLVDQDDLLGHAETSLAVAQADGVVPGWIDESN